MFLSRRRTWRSEQRPLASDVEPRVRAILLPGLFHGFSRWKKKPIRQPAIVPNGDLFKHQYIVSIYSYCIYLSINLSINLPTSFDQIWAAQPLKTMRFQLVVSKLRSKNVSKPWMAVRETLGRQMFQFVGFLFGPSEFTNDAHLVICLLQNLKCQIAASFLPSCSPILLAFPAFIGNLLLAGNLLDLG